MLFRTLPTTLLQIFGDITLYSRVIVNHSIGPDEKGPLKHGWVTSPYKQVTCTAPSAWGNRVSGIYRRMVSCLGGLLSRFNPYAAGG